MINNFHLLKISVVLLCMSSAGCASDSNRPFTDVNLTVRPVLQMSEDLPASGRLMIKIYEISNFDQRLLNLASGSKAEVEVEAAELGSDITLTVPRRSLYRLVAQNMDAANGRRSEVAYDVAVRSEESNVYTTLQFQPVSIESTVLVNSGGYSTPGSENINVNSHKSFDSLQEVIDEARGSEKFYTLDGVATDVKFNPYGAWTDSQGNVYSPDFDGSRVVRTSPEGGTTYIAGGLTSGILDGPAQTARFDSPSSVLIDGSGNILVADTRNHCIRMIDSSFNVTTFAGSSAKQAGGLDGQRLVATFDSPVKLGIDLQGNIYVIDGIDRLRRIDTSGLVTTIQ